MKQPNQINGFYRQMNSYPQFSLNPFDLAQTRNQFPLNEELESQSQMINVPFLSNPFLPEISQLEYINNRSLFYTQFQNNHHYVSPFPEHYSPQFTVGQSFNPQMPPNYHLPQTLFMQTQDSVATMPDSPVDNILEECIKKTQNVNKDQANDLVKLLSQQNQPDDDKEINKNAIEEPRTPINSLQQPIEISPASENQVQNTNIEPQQNKRKTKNNHVKQQKMPWRPSTAYELFCQQKRPVLRNQNPETCSREINRMLGLQWRSMGAQDKDQFVQESKRLQVNAVNTLKEYESRVGMKLKKPVCAYSWFLKEKRQVFHQENPLLDHNQLLRLIVSTWKNLSEDERKPFQARAKEDYQRYMTDKKLFAQQFLSETHSQQEVDGQIDSNDTDGQNEPITSESQKKQDIIKIAESKQVGQKRNHKNVSINDALSDIDDQIEEPMIVKKLKV